MNEKNQSNNLLVTIVTVAAIALMLLVIGGTYVYFTNDGDSPTGTDPAENQVVDDGSSQSSPHKVLKPAIPDDQTPKDEKDAEQEMDNKNSGDDDGKETGDENPKEDSNTNQGEYDQRSNGDKN